MNKLFPNEKSKHDKILSHAKTWKVITTGMNGENKSFGNIFIGKPGEIHTNTYFSFEVKNKLEAESLESYLKCKLPNVMLGLRKSGRSIIPNTCKWIPLIPLDRQWNDEDIYKFLQLNDIEIKLIEDYIKCNKMTFNKDTKKKNKHEKKTMIIMDEIKVSINDNDEIKTSEDMDKYTIPKLKKICDDNKIKRTGCKKKQDYIDCIMSSNQKIIIDV